MTNKALAGVTHLISCSSFHLILSSVSLAFMPVVPFLGTIFLVLHLLLKSTA